MGRFILALEQVFEKVDDNLLLDQNLRQLYDFER